MLAIECDGPKYYSSRVARDRDRLREQMLGKLGWRIHRIWSTDWYRNRTESVQHLMAALDDARLAPKLEAATAAPTHLDVTVDEQAMVEGGAEFVIEITGGSWVDEVPTYEMCRSLRIAVAGELHLVAVDRLAMAVEDIVSVEAPVHIDEVVRRLRVLWGLGRAGSRIRAAVESAVRACVRRKQIEFRKNFLYLPKKPALVRRRGVDPPARIEFICNEEISEAIKLVLRRQFATEAEDLVTAVARVFGIQSTSEATAARISAVLRDGPEFARAWTIDEAEVVRLIERV